MSEEHIDRERAKGSAGIDATTSLAGKLKDLSLGEILQIVSLSRRSGLLRLEGPIGEATIFIRSGLITHAGRSDEKEGVLSLLVHHGLVDMPQIEALKERLEACDRYDDLIDLLNKKLNISHESFQKVLKKRIEELIFSLFLWEEGTFSFQLVGSEADIPQFERMRPFFLEEGINAQFLVMEGARRQDELKRDLKKPGPAPDEEAAVMEFASEWETHHTGEELMDPDETSDVSDTGMVEVPESIPVLPDSIAKVLILVTGDESMKPRLKDLLDAADVAVFNFEDAASALTKIQELRSHRIFPVVACDLQTKGITNRPSMGGLDILSSQWDLGFSLPSVLFSDGNIPYGLREELAAVDAATLLIEDQETLPGKLAELVLSFITPEPDLMETAEGEFFDIREELSEDLEGLDLPFDALGDEEFPAQPQAQDPLMAKLGSYVSELKRQDISGETTLLALRFATEFASRAILFLVRKNDIKGLGQFGVILGEGQDADSAIRNLKIPLAEDSIFTRVVGSQQSYRGKPTGSDTENLLFESLGGKPEEIYIGPVVSMGKVAVILYGDDFPEGEGLQPTHTLDIFLSHTGLALDRAFLEMKLKSEGEGS